MSIDLMDNETFFVQIVRRLRGLGMRGLRPPGKVQKASQMRFACVHDIL